MSSTRAYLTDFGLAGLTAPGSRVTRTGEWVGTPAYTSPEQASGVAGPRSDVWRLGCVLYEALAGRRAFPHAEPAEALAAILHHDPPALRARRPDVPARCVRLVRACLAKRPGHRPATAAAVRDDCQRLLDGRAPRARPRRQWGRWGLAAGAAGVALAWTAAAWAPPPPPAADPVEALAARARALRAEPARAADLLAEATTHAPTRFDLWVHLGLACWASGQPVRARDAWDRVPDAAPEAAAARLYRGLEAFTRLARDEARAHLEWVVGRGDAEAPLAAGALAALARDWPAARARLHGAEGWPAALLRAAVEQFATDGDHATALRHYDAALADGPQLPWALTNRGVLREARDDPVGARADFERALALDPRHADALVCRGALRRNDGDPAGARADFEAALAVAPDDVRALANLATLHVDAGARSQARAFAARAVAAGPASADAHAARAWVRILDGDRGGARADLDAALALAPAHAVAAAMRARLRLEDGELAGARADCDVALRGRPGDPSTLVTRGIARKREGDRIGARADFDAALRVAPTLATALTNRGLLRAEEGDVDGALADYAAALATDPRHLVALANRGALRLEQGDAAGAATDLAAALAAAPPDWPARDWVAARLARARAAAGGNDR